MVLLIIMIFLLNTVAIRKIYRGEKRSAIIVKALADGISLVYFCILLIMS